EAGGTLAANLVATGSLAFASHDADLDPPRRHLGVFLLADEVDLGRADIGVPGELPHLVHGRPVPDGVVDGGLAQRVDADATASQPVGVDAGGPAVVLDQPPGGLAVQVPPDQAGPGWCHRPEQRSLPVL